MTWGVDVWSWPMMVVVTSSLISNFVGPIKVTVATPFFYKAAVEKAKSLQ